MTFQRLHTSAYPPIGRWLKARRDVLGHTLAQASDLVQMSEATLELLEAERFLELPEPVFVRGYLRRYAKTLQLNPQEVIALFDAWLRVYESQVGRKAETEKTRPSVPTRNKSSLFSSISTFADSVLHSQAGQVAAVVLCLGLFSFFLSHGTGTDERIAVSTATPVTPPAQTESMNTEITAANVMAGQVRTQTNIPAAPVSPLKSWLIASETTHVQVTDKHGLIVYSGLVRAGMPVMLKGNKPFDIRAAREGTVSLVNDRLARNPARDIAVL